MLIVGIDLAAEPKNTAACLLRWDEQRVVEDVIVGRELDNDCLVELLCRADYAGIDAPFGWPQEFIDAVTAWHRGEPWPGKWEKERRARLRLRLTDHAVRKRGGPTPLSVSADSIGVCAMRAAIVLGRAVDGPVDRVRGPIFEVYPAATLAALDIQRKGYKADPDIRIGIVETLRTRFDLDFRSRHDELIRTDHALDALLSAISARAAAVGESVKPIGDVAVIAAEGWIHVPVEGWRG